MYLRRCVSSGPVIYIFIIITNKEEKNIFSTSQLAILNPRIFIKPTFVGTLKGQGD
jgi:hypothetical protein